jgi:hypothetical protein
MIVQSFFFFDCCSRGYVREQPSYDARTTIVLSSIFFYNDCIMIVNIFVMEKVIQLKNTFVQCLVQSSYNHRTMIVQSSYEHRIIAMIIQPSYNHCTSFVISAMIVQSSYNHRTHYDCSCNACTMLVNNNDDCTNIVEHTRYLAMIVQSLYNHRYFSNYFTIIVQPSYEHCTIIVISAMIVRSLYNHRTTIVR